MNVQSIWAGEMYAYSTYRPNKTFVMNARKGKAVRVEKRQEYGNARKTAYVIMVRVDEQTGEELGETTVRARDVIDFWDSYENERNAQRKRREQAELERAERYAKMMQEREDRIRRENEEREAIARKAEEQRETIVTAIVERTGIPRNAIVSVSGGSIMLDRVTMEVWLRNGTNV